MTDATTLEDLLDEIDMMPVGPQERELIERAVQVAMETGDEPGEYQARMRLTTSARMTGDMDAMLSSFAWCLAKHDADPQRFPADVDTAVDLMWQYKWMVGALSATPDVDLGTIGGVLDDMQQHYEHAGLGLGGVLMSRFEESWRGGRLDEAEDLRRRLSGMPRDSHSHCEACVRSQFGAFLVDTSREPDAIALVEELLEGGYQCGDEPEHAMARVMLPYLRAGRLDDARRMHEQSYAATRSDPDKLDIVAMHLVFCGVTGNSARGLAMLERHLGWLTHDGLNVAAHFDVLLAIGTLLSRLVADGHGELPVRGSGDPTLEPFFGAHQGAFDVAGLEAAAWAGAKRLGTAFDARNGNGHHAERIARAREVALERYDAPVGNEVFLPIPRTPAEPTDGAGWLARARDLAGIADLEGSIAAARRAVPLAEGADRADALAMLVSALIAAEERAEAEALLPERIAALRETGRDDQAALESRVGIAIFGGRTEADVAALEAELASGALTGGPLADVELTLGVVRALDGREEEATELFESAVGHSVDARPHLRHAALATAAQHHATSGDPERAIVHAEALLAEDLPAGQRAHGSLLLARLLGGQGRFDEGAQHADEAGRLAAALDARPMVVNASVVAAALLLDAGDAEQAVERQRFAITQAEALGAGTTGLRYGLGQQLLRAGQATEAIGVLRQVVADEEAAGVEPESLAQTLVALGSAHAEDSEFDEAVAAWDAAIERQVSAGATEAAAATGLTKGQLFLRYGRPDEALVALLPALERARTAPDNLRLLVDVLNAVGAGQLHTADPAALETYGEVLSLAREHGAEWLAADAQDSLARALQATGRADEAVPLAFTAADAYAAAGDVDSAIGSELFAANALVQLERPDEAVTAYRAALDRAADNPDAREMVAWELGDYLDSIGREAEAAQVRALVDDED